LEDKQRPELAFSPSEKLMKVHSRSAKKRKKQLLWQRRNAPVKQRTSLGKKLQIKTENDKNYLQTQREEIRFYGTSKFRIYTFCAAKQRQKYGWWDIGDALKNQNNGKWEVFFWRKWEDSQLSIFGIYHFHTSGPLGHYLMSNGNGFSEVVLRLHSWNSETVCSN